MTRRTALPYRDALRWILDNDDTEWLDPEEGVASSSSVTASLVADIYGRTDDEVRADLLRLRERKIS